MPAGTVGGDLHRRLRGRPRLPRPPRAHGRAVRARPGRRPRRADVPHRGPRPLARGRQTSRSSGGWTASSRCAASASSPARSRACSPGTRTSTRCRWWRRRAVPATPAWWRTTRPAVAPRPTAPPAPTVGREPAQLPARPAARLHDPGGVHRAPPPAAGAHGPGPDRRRTRSGSRPHGAAAEQQARSRASGTRRRRRGCPRCGPGCSHRDHVGLDDDFFALGGNSLLAAEMLARTRAIFGISADSVRPLTRCLLRDPTLRGFAAAAAGRPRGPAGRRRRPGRDRLRRVRPGSTSRSGWTAAPSHPRPDWRSPREVLLTGATGFLGAHLLRELLAPPAPGSTAWSARATTRPRCRRIGRPPSATSSPGRPTAASCRCPVTSPSRGSGCPTRAFRDLARERRRHLPRGRAGELHLPVPGAAGGQRGRHPRGDPAGRPVPGHTRALRVDHRRARGPRRRGHPRGDRGDAARAPRAAAHGLRRDEVRGGRAAAERGPRGPAGGDLPAAGHRRQRRHRRLEHLDRDVRADQVHRPTPAWRPTSTCRSTSCPPTSARRPSVTSPSRDGGDRAHLPSRQPGERPARRPGRPAAGPRVPDRGRSLRRLGQASWRGRPPVDPSHPMAAFLPLFVDRDAASGLTVAEMYLAHIFPSYSRSNTERALAGSGIAFPPVDGPLLDRNIDRLMRDGLPARPVGQARCPRMSTNRYPDWESFAFPPARPVHRRSLPTAADPADGAGGVLRGPEPGERARRVPPGHRPAARVRRLRPHPQRGPLRGPGGGRDHRHRRRRGATIRTGRPGGRPIPGR